jgi:hypothetical protein
VAVTFSEVYFLHASNVTETPDGMEEPPIGSTIHFDVSPARDGGKYPQAINARIIFPTKLTREETRAEIQKYIYVPKAQDSAKPTDPAKTLATPSADDAKEGE